MKSSRVSFAAIDARPVASEAWSPFVTNRSRTRRPPARNTYRDSPAGAGSRAISWNGNTDARSPA
jgi:hypothetical protein